jgi:hypothetical protein
MAWHRRCHRFSHPSLRRLQEALPQERKAGPPIALALHELQAMDLALGNAIAPLEGEPGGDRRQVLLQPRREPGELLDPTVHGLGQPGRYRRRRALREQVQDAMTHQID